MNDPTRLRHIRLVKEIKNENNQTTYREYDNGLWEAYKYNNRGERISSGHGRKQSSVHLVKEDKNDRVTYREYSDGYWEIYRYDEHGNRTYYRDSYGKWELQSFDDNNKLTHYKNSSGYEIVNGVTMNF